MRRHGCTYFFTLVYYVLLCVCFHVDLSYSKEFQLLTSYRSYLDVYTRAEVANSSNLVLILWQCNNKINQPHRIWFAVHKWTKHGQTCLAAPEKSYVADLAVCMDIHPNPGWDSTTNSKTVTTYLFIPNRMFLPIGH